MQLGSESVDVAEAVSLDTSGNLWIVGAIQGGVDFGGGLLSPSGGADLASVNLDPSGGHLHSAVYGDALDDLPLTMAAHGDGVVVGGHFLGSLDLGAVCQLGPADAQDGFVARFDSAGSCLCAARVGGPDQQTVTDVAVDAAGVISFTGMYYLELWIVWEPRGSDPPGPPGVTPHGPRPTAAHAGRCEDPKPFWLHRGDDRGLMGP